MTTLLRQIGVITRPHGLRGEIKVRPETDDPSRFERLESVRIGKNEGEAKTRRVRAVRFQPMSGGLAVVLGVEGITDRDAAELLVGQGVWAAEADLPPLGDDEIFISDLIGLEVFDDAHESAGRVIDVLDLPAQPVLVIGRPSGRSVLVPFVPDLIESVGDDGIVVRPVEGLLDPDEQATAG